MPPCLTLSPCHPVTLSLQECLDAWRREARPGVVGRTRYFVWGRGPALVFVPGLCSDGQTFVPLMARLRQDYCCVGYDLAPEGTHEQYVDDLFALLDHLRLRQVDVLGSSFGSTVTLAALLRQPARFRRAILQGGFARRPLAPAEVFCCAWARYLPGTVAQVPLLARLTYRQQYAPFEGRAAEDWHYFLSCEGRTPLRAFGRRALVMHQLDLRPRLREIAHPVLLVCGDRDPLVARCCQEDLRAGLPRAAQAEIEGCGHHPYLSHPEVLAEVIRRFLSSAWDLSAC